MQRLSLHFRGIQVPALGSPRDVIFRDYLIFEAKKEAKKHEMMMMIAMASANIPQQAKAEWFTTVKKTYEAYVSYSWGIEPKAIKDEDQNLLDYYEKVIKKSKVKLVNTEEGLVATGVPGFKSDPKAKKVAPAKKSNGKISTGFGKKT